MVDNREFSYTEKDFVFLRNLIKEYAGINLSASKRELVYTRLIKRIRILGFSSFSQYCGFLKKDQDDEISHFVNAITTNVTEFFREKHHFEFLSNTWLPEYIKKYSDQKKLRIRIWSAGCSTGEEPYSIAITLKNALSDAQKDWDIKILATDLDSSVLERARSGNYPTHRLQNCSEKIKNKWFCKDDKNDPDYFCVHEDIKKMVVFKSLNLINQWPMKGTFDLIFCRNVIIYFDREGRSSLLNRFEEILKYDGYLFLGHSESVLGYTKNLQLVGRTIHRKCSQ